jgi:hypothetical protein
MTIMPALPSHWERPLALGFFHALEEFVRPHRRLIDLFVHSDNGPLFF